MARIDGLGDAGGEYVEIDPPRRLVFTWTWEDDRDQLKQLIEVDFEESGGVTTVRFTHSSLWDAEAVRALAACPVFTLNRPGRARN